MQCAWVTSRHRENDRYWRKVGMQVVDINYYKLSEICYHAKIEAFVTSWSCAQSKEAIQDHWLVDNSTASAFGVYTIGTKMQAVQVGTLEQSIRRAHGQALVWILLYSLHRRIRTIVQQTGYSHMPYQRNHCYIVPVVTYPRLNPYIMSISLFGHILNQVINMLLFAYDLHLSYYI